MLPPGPSAPPSVQTVEWIARPTHLLRRAAARYGDPFTLRTLWTDGPLVITADPAAARAILTGDPAIFEAGKSSKHLEPFAGPTSILLLDGDEHLRQRRLMLPPFHGDALKRHAGRIAELAAEEVARWPRGAPVAALPRMRALTLRVIGEVVFGGHERELHAAIGRALGLTASLPRLLAMGVAPVDLGPRSPYGAFTRAVAGVDRLLLERIERAGAPEGSIFAMLLAARHEDGTAPSAQEVRDQLVTLLAAGHETTATALAWALERLARHPEEVARARAEGTPRLDAIVKETLRIRPVLSIAPRRLAAPAVVAGRELPAGTHVAAGIYLLHRRADVFGPDPLAFRPERWLGAGPPPDQTAWIPFGGGVRRCVGAAFAAMEMREVLRAVVAGGRGLEPERAAGERMRRASVVLAPHRGARVRLR